ncbi:MAG: RidA family protein [Nitriliruptorales bacterium]|nr:RidA family protein [Nitriliruptorales bacterium]
MSTALERLAARGLLLPPVPEPAAAYRPWTRAGDLVFTAGQLPTRDGALAATGLLGRDLATAEGQALAELAALNLLAVANAACDGLEDVRVVKLTVFVASAPSFTEQHLVANGASQLLADVLGERGRHARSAVGVPCLPLHAPVEVEAILAA